jgi:transcriptional regulator with XRE-family HTH domain
MNSTDPGTRNRRLGDRIRKRRHVLDLEQEELAARVGVHVNSVQKWEAGKNYPARHIGRLEQVLGISLDEEPEPAQVIPPTLIDYIRRTMPPDFAEQAVAALEELATGPAAGAAPVPEGAAAGRSRNARRAG